MKLLAGWKTVLFNAGIVLVLALNQFGLFGQDNPAPTPEQLHGGLDQLDAGLVALGAFGNAVLRAVTNTTIFKSTSPAPQPPPSS